MHCTLMSHKSYYGDIYRLGLGSYWYVKIEVLQGARLSLNGFSHHRFSQDSLAFSAILRVNGIGRSMAKTIVTIAI